MQRIQTKALVMSLATLAALQFGCGARSKTRQEPTTPPTIEESAKTDLSGTVLLGDGKTPFVGVNVALYNHTSGIFRLQALANNGSFSLPVSEFKVGETYSLQLMDFQMRYLTAITFDGQRGFTYAGGEGIDLGSMMVARSALGLVDSNASDLDANLSDGFTGVESVVTDIPSRTLPSPIATAEAVSDLVIVDANIALDAFYRRLTSPSAYRSALAAWSRVRFITEAADTIYDGALAYGPARKNLFRYADSIDATPQNSALWSSQQFRLKQYSATRFERSIFVGALPETEQVYVLKANVAAGQREYPVAMSRVITVPPQIEAYDQGSGTLTNIDYTSNSAENGLTIPLCRNASPLDISVVVPQDAAGNNLDATILSNVEISLRYFANTNGTETAITPRASDYPTAYQTIVTTDGLPTGSSTWDPDQQVINHSLAASAATTHQFSVPAELLLTTIGTQSIARIRLLITYFGSDGQRSGIIFWLKNC